MEKSEFWQSPLAELSKAFPAGLCEVSVPTQINLRGNPDDPEFLAATEKVLGIPVPIEPCRVSSGGAVRVLWLGPDEWLVIAEQETANLLAAFSDKLSGQHAAFTDVGANRIVLEISGPHVRDVLMKSCEMDFHPRAFGLGKVAQTTLAKSPTIIEQIENDKFHLYVRNSFARYCAEWLIDSYSEFVD